MSTSIIALFSSHDFPCGTRGLTHEKRISQCDVEELNPDRAIHKMSMAYTSHESLSVTRYYRVEFCSKLSSNLLINRNSVVNIHNEYKNLRV